MSSFQVLNGKIMGGPVIPVESMKLLWTNPDPSVAFEAQNITLASEDYDFLLWITKSYSSNNVQCSTIIMKGYSGCISISLADSNKIVLIRRRDVTYVDNCTYYVKAGWTSNTVDNEFTTNNNVCVPLFVYGIKKNSVGGGDDDHLMKYSTNEQVVGEWIDGKPIYQKTITGTTGSNSDPVTFPIGALIDKVIGVESIVEASSGTMYFPHNFWANTVSSNLISGFKLSIMKNSSSVSDNVISVVSSAASTLSSPFHVTIKYTKTTD